MEQSTLQSLNPYSQVPWNEDVLGSDYTEAEDDFFEVKIHVIFKYSRSPMNLNAQLIKMCFFVFYTFKKYL